MTRNLRNLVPLGSVIAEREFFFQRAGEPVRTVCIQVGAPVPDEKYAGKVLCPVVIKGFDREEKLVLGGVDSLQALSFAMAAVSGLLRSAAHQQGGTLTWLGSEDLGLQES